MTNKDHLHSKQPSHLNFSMLAFLWGFSLCQEATLQATNLSEDAFSYISFSATRTEKEYPEILQTHLKEHNALPQEGSLGLFLANEDTMSHVSSFLTLSEFSALGRTCQAAQFFYDRALTQTDFLVSTNVYAQEIRNIFKDVTITPPLDTLRISHLAINDYETLGVLFRDAEHLEEIAQKVPFVHSKALYFMKDENARTDKCFINDADSVIRSYTFNLCSNTPLNLQGKITTPLMLTLPGGSLVTGLTCPLSPRFFPDAKSLFDITLMSSSPFFVDAMSIASYYRRLEEYSIHNRLNEAHTLRNTRKLKRQTNPEQYPHIHQLESCDAYLYNDAESCTLFQLDCLSSQKPLLYKARSFDELKKLSLVIPSMECLYVIDPSSSECGIYCDGEFNLRIRYSICTKGHLLLTGHIEIPEDYFLIEAENIWLVNLHLEARIIEASTSARVINLKETKTKPDDMPQNLWDNLLNAKLP